MELPANVKALGLVSLLNDASSEMIYPLLPAFVAGTLGAGPAFLGLLEGTAEALSSLLKLISGRLSDRWSRRKPLAVAGYALAVAARPWMALATRPWHALGVRLADRLGKGLRSAPRDVLLAAAVTPDLRGRAFGFHRAMDHAGAMLGPLLATTVLALGGDLRLVFALSALPGVLAVLTLIFAVHEAPAARPAASGTDRTGPQAALPRALHVYLGLLTLFALGSSSDAFLLWRAQECGLPLAGVPLLWTLHHALKAALGTWGGALADRIGRKRAIMAGWWVYGCSYLGFAAAGSVWQVLLVFALYSLYFALCEGAEKALLAELSPAAARGRAFGWFHALSGAALLPANLLTGVLWQRHGAGVALGLGAALALTAALGLWRLIPERAGGGV